MRREIWYLAIGIWACACPSWHAHVLACPNLAAITRVAQDAKQAQVVTFLEILKQTVGPVKIGNLTFTFDIPTSTIVVESPQGKYQFTMGPVDGTYPKGIQYTQYFPDQTKPLQTQALTFPNHKFGTENLVRQSFIADPDAHPTVNRWIEDQPQYPMQLSPIQEAALLFLLRLHQKSGIFLPPATGKTEVVAVFASLLSQLTENQPVDFVYVVQHTKVLPKTMSTFQRTMGLDDSQVLAFFGSGVSQKFISPGTRVIGTTRTTWADRMRDMEHYLTDGRRKVVFFDECQETGSPIEYKAILAQLNRLRTAHHHISQVGMSGTPWRHDTADIVTDTTGNNVFWGLVPSDATDNNPNVAQAKEQFILATEMGLTPPIYGIHIVTAVNRQPIQALLSGLDTDGAITIPAAWVDDILARLSQHRIRDGQGNLKVKERIAIFVARKNIADALVLALNSRMGGNYFRPFHSNSTEKDTLDWMKSNAVDIRGIVAVRYLDKGVDIPGLNRIVIGKMHTTVQSLLQGPIGRANRPDEFKTESIIFDYSGMMYTFTAEELERIMPRPQRISHTTHHRPDPVVVFDGEILHPHQANFTEQYIKIHDKPWYSTSENAVSSTWTAEFDQKKFWDGAMRMFMHRYRSNREVTPNGQLFRENPKRYFLKNIVSVFPKAIQDQAGQLINRHLRDKALTQKSCFLIYTGLMDIWNQHWMDKWHRLHANEYPPINLATMDSQIFVTLPDPHGYLLKIIHPKEIDVQTTEGWDTVVKIWGTTLTVRNPEIHPNRNLLWFRTEVLPHIIAIDEKLFWENRTQFFVQYFGNYSDYRVKNLFYNVWLENDRKAYRPRRKDFGDFTFAEVQAMYDIVKTCLDIQLIITQPQLVIEKHRNAKVGYRFATWDKDYNPETFAKGALAVLTSQDPDLFNQDISAFVQKYLISALPVSLHKRAAAILSIIGKHKNGYDNPRIVYEVYHNLIALHNQLVVLGMNNNIVGFAKNHPHDQSYLRPIVLDPYGINYALAEHRWLLTYPQWYLVNPITTDIQTANGFATVMKNFCEFKQHFINEDVSHLAWIDHLKE